MIIRTRPRSFLPRDEKCSAKSCNPDLYVMMKRGSPVNFQTNRKSV